MKQTIAAPAVFLMFLGCSGALAADKPTPIVLRMLKHDLSPPLHEMAAQVTGTLPAGGIMPVTPNATDPGLGFNFPGIAAEMDNPKAPLPPDTNGAAGMTQFFQWVNTVFAVFNKSDGSVLLGPSLGSSIWKGFGAPCANHNSGQPIAQYDKQANRWVLAQPVLVAPYTYCMAVSTTSDATGHYYRFAFDLTLPAGTPNSPRLAVWPDAYYASFNILQSGAVTGALAVAFDRLDMLNGSALQPVAFTLGSGYTYMLPSDWDGTATPTGEPDFYLRVASPSTLDLFKFHVDFASPANSTFSSEPIIIGVTPGDAGLTGDACTRKPGKCLSIAQPPPGVLLNAAPNAAMYRLPWRRRNRTEHLLVNQTIFGSGSEASIVWYDIIDPNGTPTRAQQGSVSNASINYWMGSIAEDKMGDIALGFSASSSALFPSIYFAGRLATDPNGAMGTPELIVGGSNVQTDSGAWGNLSSMTIDPQDDCTFWYTTEFIQTPPTGSPNWSTWIASLRFPACQ